LNGAVRAIFSILILVAAAPVFAQRGDPLHSPECDAARATLERALDDTSSHRRGATVALAQARKDAIEACLGREDAARERSGAPYPAIAVRPPAVDVPRIAPVPMPSLDVPRPAAITTCDPGGCWDSEGRRLNSVGPVLMGPRGPCVTQAGVVHCP
jgi:hypothetical protein